MAREFILPDFLMGASAEEIQQRMMNELPEDIDRMPGGFPYDMTMPTALEKAELINYHLARAIMIAFPEWSWGDWLDLHARQQGISRRDAGYAAGEVTVTGVPGTRLPAGFIVCTPATDSSPSVLFAFDNELVLPDGGTASASVTAVSPGASSNVQAGTVTIMASPINGISLIENEDDITGGTERESDSSLFERLDAEYASKGTSYVGNDADFIRWAKEVVGVGECIVLPAWEGPGTVKLALVDSNGQPANAAICQAVYEHIVSPDNRQARLMATGSATLTVVPADTVGISFAASGLELAEGTTIQGVTEAFSASIAAYYKEARDDREVRYVKAHAILAGTEGVEDFASFRMNGGVANIPLGETEFPSTGTVNFETE